MMNKLHIYAALFIAAVIMPAMAGCGSDKAGSSRDMRENANVSEYKLNDIFFDTVISIRFDAGENGDELTDGCRSICDMIERTFSRTDEDSELYSVNHRTSDRVEVSAPLAAVVEAGLDYYELSGGRFDITIAPVSDLWDFKSGKAEIPPESLLQSALRKVDASRVHVESETAGGTESVNKKWYLRFDSPDTMIDLGALAKGYAADRIADYLKDNGVTSGLINLGGNVLAIGSKEDGSAWTIGIQKPFDTGTVDTVEIVDESVVTSGVYERCFEKDGVLYHHVLDPDTGFPVSNGLWGVSIISDSSLTGDALSTICLLLGRDEAEELLRGIDGVKAIFVDDRLHVTSL